VRKASILGVNSWEDALGVLKPALHTAASSLPRVDRLHEQAADLVRQAGKWSSVRVKEPK
jgi:hypothetical protein